MRQSTLYRYEHGQTMPDAYVLSRIAAHAGTTVEALLKGEGRNQAGRGAGPRGGKALSCGHLLTMDSLF